MKTKQIVFTEVNMAKLLDAEYTAPKDEEVLVENVYSAISCGTERANITGARNTIQSAEDAPVVFPRYCGYSAVGYVREAGKSVTDFTVGDRVLVFGGLHRKHITIHQRQVMKIPDLVPFADAATAFISTFPLAAIRKTKLEMGESAMVMGLGILGMFAVKLLKANGAMPIVAVDPVAERRAFALRMGADCAFDPAEPDFCEKVKAVTHGGANVVIEVTGLGAGMVQALDCMKKFGRLALLGCTRKSDFHVDYYQKVHAPGITIVGAHTIARPNTESFPGYWTDRDDIDAVLRLLEGKRLSYRDIICEIHSPEDAPEVYTRLVNDRNFPIGVLFDWTKIQA